MALTAVPRILAILTDAWGSGGGIAQYNRDWARAMAATGARTDVACYGYAIDDGSLPRATTLVHASGSRMRFVAAVVAAARRVRPDLVFCGHLHLAPLAALVAAQLGVPWWLQLHGIDAWAVPGRLRRASCERARLVTAVSRYTRERVGAWWRGAPERLRVLPNTVDEVFSPGPRDAALAARLGLGSGAVLLTVGRLAAAERYKGQDRVIACLPALRRIHPDLQFVIAGDGDDRERLQACAREHGVADAVRFVGPIAHTELPALYRLADAFAMPSTGEGFGIAFLEAMACGVPALGLDADGSRDPLVDGTLGQLVPTCALTDGLLRVLAPARERGAPLAARVRERFGRPRFEAQAARLLERALTEAA